MKFLVLFILFQITMPECHKIYPNCIGHVPPEWFGLIFNCSLLTNYIEIMLLTLSDSASLLNLLLILAFPLPRKVIFKLNLVPELWRVCTVLNAIIFSRVTIPCSKSCFPISLLAFFWILWNISHLKIPMMTQSDRSTCQFLHFTLMIPSTFLKHSYISLFFMQLQDFYNNWQAHDGRKGTGED